MIFFYFARITNPRERIHSLWEAGKTEIPFKDLFDLNIPAVASEIKIGNILLSNYLGIDKSYDIALINREKNIDNKWLDNAVMFWPPINHTRIDKVRLNFRYYFHLNYFLFC